MLGGQSGPASRTGAIMRRAILLLPGASLLALVVFSLAGAQALQATPRLDARLALRAYESLTDLHLQDVLSALKTLATTQDAMSADWQRLKPPLSQLAQGLSTSAAVWF